MNAVRERGSRDSTNAVRVTGCVDPLAPLRTMGGRLAPPTEALAQAIAERVIGLVVGALDLNELLAEIDLNAVLERSIWGRCWTG